MVDVPPELSPPPSDFVVLVLSPPELEPLPEPLLDLELELELELEFDEEDDGGGELTPVDEFTRGLELEVGGVG